MIDIQQRAKEDVRAFWNRSSCGEVYAKGLRGVEGFEAQALERYRLEPYLLEFGRFSEIQGKDVLEVGVGFGADHVEMAKCNPRSLQGIDLTPRSVELTGERLAGYGFESNVRVADAEHLPFQDESFDFVWSWGVIHHTPDTPAAAKEILRVLRPGGEARVMIYQRNSLVGYMLWLRYGLGRLRPLTALNSLYAQYLESPGTKAYTVEEARALFRDASRVSAEVKLSFGDLIEGESGQRHRGVTLAIARRLWPRKLIQKYFAGHGLALLLEVVK